MLPPRLAGTNKTYTIQVALDGVNFLETPSVKLTVKNEGIKGETEWVECNKEDLITLTAKYIDKATGKEIAPAYVNKGYRISEYKTYDIKAKEIEGYKLVSGPNMDEYNGYFLQDKGVYDFVFQYEKLPEEAEEKSEFTGAEGGISVSEADAISIGNSALRYVEENYEDALAQLGDNYVITSKLVMKEIEEVDLSDKEKQAFKEAGKELTIGKYYDIRVEANVESDNQAVEGLTGIDVSELKNAVTLSLTVPSELTKTGRSYTMLHYNGAEAELLSMNTVGQKVAFTVQTFSPYALAYKDAQIVPDGDTKPGDNNQNAGQNVGQNGSGQNMNAGNTANTNKQASVTKTADTSNLLLWMLLLAGSVMAGMAVLFRKTKRKF